MRCFLRTPLIVAVVLSPLSAGCSDGGPTITGTVTMNGKPLGNAEVTFEPFDPASGLGADTVRTDEAGRFTIAADRDKNPLKPGKYVVFVNKWVDAQGNVPAAEDLDQLKAAGDLRNEVPAKYWHIDSQDPYTVEIQPGDNNLKIDLKSP